MMAISQSFCKNALQLYKTVVDKMVRLRPAHIYVGFRSSTQPTIMTCRILIFNKGRNPIKSGANFITCLCLGYNSVSFCKEITWGTSHAIRNYF